MVSDGRVWITTEHEKQESGWQVIFYNVRDILSDLDDAANLTETVMSVVE